MRMITLMSVLVCVGPALAQDKIVIDPFEHKSPNGPESVLAEALPEAAEALLKKAFPNPENPRGFKMAVEAARKSPKEFVKYEILDGPRARIGAPGYVVLRVEAERAKLKALVDQQSAKADSAPSRKYLFAVTEEIRINTSNPALHTIEPNSTSKVMVSIVSDLVKNEFDVVDPRQLEFLRQRKLNALELDGADKRLIEKIARDQGADIIVYGHVEVQGPLIKKIARTGERVYYEWEVTTTNAQAVWTDTAEFAFAIPYPKSESARRLATTMNGTAGAQRALEDVGEIFASQFVNEAATLATRTSITLEFHGVDGFRQSRQVNKWVQKLPGVSNVKRIGGGELPRYELETNQSIFDVLDALLTLSDAADLPYRLEPDNPVGSTAIIKIVPN